MRSGPRSRILLWVAGEAFYLVGAVGHGLRKPDRFPGVFGCHELRHLFVLAGSACPYVMRRYVLPRPPR